MFLYVQIIFSAYVISCSSQEFKYKVVAPEYICSKENMSQTAIRLIGEDVPHLKYNWSVSFHMDELTESKNLKQRHVLMIWRSVRKINQILQTTSKEDLSRGVIFINNSMLTPDVKYIINLIVQKQLNNATKTDKQQISLEYIGKTSTKSTISASLSGPEVTYSDMPYTAKAEVSSCNDNSDYQLSWQLLDRAKRMVREESSKSRILHLLPGTLSSGNEYSIKCLVLDRKSNKNKSSEVLQVNVLKRGMQLSTYTKYLKIGTNQPIYINAFFSDPDGIADKLTFHAQDNNIPIREWVQHQKIKFYARRYKSRIVLCNEFIMFEWQCANSANKPCTDFESSNSTELLIPKGFQSPGSYHFSISAKKGSISVKDSTVVDVAEELTPIIDVENAITSCNPSDGVKISAHVSRLVPGCTLQWKSVEEEDFEAIDLNSMPGTPGTALELTEDEDNLDDLSDESSNDSFIDKQHDLFLSSSDDGSWKGLQSNSKYLFRLTASCPCFDNSSEKSEEKFVISTADVVVTTNKLPLIKPLQVSPKSGQAMRTIFSFRTNQPSDSTKPLLYKFGIINKSNKKLYLIKQYDVTSAVTILPFYDASIQTILEVCDSKSACNFTLGPKVIVKLPNNFTVAETGSLLNNFNKSIQEQDYFNAFTVSSMLLQTANQMSSNVTLNLLDRTIKNITQREIKLFLTATDDSWVLPATSLLKYIKILDSDIQLPQDILNDILSLRDKISEKQNTLRKKQSKSEKLAAPSRKLLSVRVDKKSERIVNEINIDEIKDYLEISELAIKRLTDFERVDTEKQKLREKLQYYIPRICQFLYNNYKTNVRIELSTIIFDVERINLIRKYNEFMFIPFETTLAAKLQLGRDLAERFRRHNGMCLGKIVFLDDYFHIPQYVYDAKLYSALEDDFLEVDSSNFAIIIEMPIKSQASNDQMFQCVLWEYGDWDMSKCRTISEHAGKVKCACRSLGYFSMVPVERPSTTTTTNRISTRLGIETITQQYHAESDILTTNTPMRNGTFKEGNIRQQTTTEIARSKQYQTVPSNLSSAAVWSISLLSIGIFTLLLAFLVLLRKLQKSNVQSFQSIEYARYFDEHNLE